MVVDEHPVLVVDSTSLNYDIIFGANFLDKFGITLDYDNDLGCWMEYTIPLCNTNDFFHTQLLPLSHCTNWDRTWRWLPWHFLCGLICNHILDAKYEQVNVHNIAFDQCHLLLDQQWDLFNILSKHKNYLMPPLESTLIRRFKLTSIKEIILFITFLTLNLASIGNISNKNSITGLNLFF